MVDFDRDLESRVTNFLAERYFPALRQLQVVAEEGTVRLSGTVAWFHEKQVALHCCQRVAGVRAVIDEVQVASR